MADTVTETPASEIRAAVKRLRCEHSYTLTSGGRCVHCALSYLEYMVEVRPLERLHEPLASWLEETARQFDAPPCDDPSGVCNHCERREDFNDALAVARALNGSTP